MFKFSGHTPLLINAVFTPKYSDRQAIANSADPDQIQQYMASDQGLNYFPLIKQILDSQTGSKIDLFKFTDKHGKCLKILYIAVSDKTA